MKNLFVIITNSRNRSDIDSSKFSWLDKETHVLLSDVNISELNSIGFNQDDGVSHKINHRLYFFFKNNRSLIERYDWVTFLGDNSYVFPDRVNEEIEKRPGERIPRLIGNDTFTQCDFFRARPALKDPTEKVFNLCTGLSINKKFIIETTKMIDNFSEEEKNNFLKETLLEEMFFCKVAERIEARKHVAKNRVFINYCDNFEDNFNNYSVIAGLNPMEKTIIMRSES